MFIISPLLREERERKDFSHYKMTQRVYFASDVIKACLLAVVVRRPLIAESTLKFKAVAGLHFTLLSTLFTQHQL
jgi:hypothetical protein